MTSPREPLVRFMEQMVSLDYAVRVPPVQRRFDEHMREQRITGHRCPSCGLVYVPPKGFCPMCVVTTTDEHEVDVGDRGVITSFTVLTPIQYRGQHERNPYVLANLLLDGADSTVGQQRIGGIPLDEVRMGMRVRAEWLADREVADDAGPGARWGIGNLIRHWVPTGEPDVSAETFQEHVL